MIKKLSIIALSVTGIVLAGCSNQANTDTAKDTKPKTEKVTKDKTSDSKKNTDSKSTNSSDNSAKSQDNTTQTSNNGTANQNNSTQNSNSTNSSTANNDTSKSQPTTPNNQVTSGQAAVTYLFSKLTNLDKTKVSGLYNGTVYDIDGKSTYRVNLYKKGESQPYTAYNVYADGTYTQVW